MSSPKVRKPLLRSKEETQKDERMTESTQLKIDPPQKTNSIRNLLDLPKNLLEKSDRIETTIVLDRLSLFIQNGSLRRVVNASLDCFSSRDDLRFEKGHQILHDINGVISPGKFVAILGTSGSGKVRALSSLSLIPSRIYLSLSNLFSNLSCLSNLIFFEMGNRRLYFIPWLED